jgi:hypothetical protein
VRILLRTQAAILLRTQAAILLRTQAAILLKTQAAILLRTQAAILLRIQPTANLNRSLYRVVVMVVDLKSTFVLQWTMLKLFFLFEW